MRGLWFFGAETPENVRRVTLKRCTVIIAESLLTVLKNMNSIKPRVDHKEATVVKLELAYKAIPESVKSRSDYIDLNHQGIYDVLMDYKANGIIGLLLVFRSQGDPDKYAVEFVFGWHHVMSSVGDLRFDDNSGTLLLETRHTIYEYRIIEQVSLDRLVMVERIKDGREDENRRMH